VRKDGEVVDVIDPEWLGVPSAVLVATPLITIEDRQVV
jgi:hypothetical protein